MLEDELRTLATDLMRYSIKLRQLAYTPHMVENQLLELSENMKWRAKQASRVLERMG